jgi:hypothetical protein
MTATRDLISPKSPRWSRVLERVEHQVYHLPEYVTFDAELCAGRPLAFVYEEPGGVWLLPLIVRWVPGTDRIDAVSPYGYPGPVSDRRDEAFWERALAALLGTLAEQGVVSLFVRLDPLVDVPYRALQTVGTLVTHGPTVSIDLRLSYEAWWLQLRKYNRRTIRQALRNGWECVVDDWSYLDDFLAVYDETMTRKGAAPAYRLERDYFERLRAALGDRAHLMLLLADGQLIDGNVMLSTGTVLQAHLAGTRTRYLPHASRLFFHEAFRWAQLQGFEVLHLGGGVGAKEDSVLRFKQGFSLQQHPFRSLRVVVDPGCYRRLTLMRPVGSVVDDGTGFFPSYRIPSGSPTSRGPRLGDEGARS